jgi:hypothetical protein
MQSPVGALLHESAPLSTKAPGDLQSDHRMEHVRVA